MAFESSLLSSASSATSNTTTSTASRLKAANYGISMASLDEDTEPIIEIDGDLRKITIPDELYNIGVAGDHLSETIYFNAPRYFDGKDLSEHTCIIRCINAGGEYFESDVCDLEVYDDSITFGWAIDNRATCYNGVINFTVQFETIDNGIQYQWQTTPAQLNILAGLDIEKTITEKDNVIFRSLTAQVQSLQLSVQSLLESQKDMADMQEQIEQLNEEINYLKGNVVYALDENV